MPRYRALHSFSGPVATAPRGAEIELTEEQAEQLGGLVELTPEAAAEKAAAEKAAASQPKKGK